MSCRPRPRRGEQFISNQKLNLRTHSRARDIRRVRARPDRFGRWNRGKGSGGTKLARGRARGAAAAAPHAPVLVLGVVPNVARGGVALRGEILAVALAPLRRRANTPG